MNDLFSLTSPFSNFNVSPTTNWERFLNPQFFITLNGQDAHIENQVLAAAGSYGKQLGRMMAVVNVLLKHVRLDELSPQDRIDIEKFQETSRKVDEVVSAERNQPPRQFPPAEIENAIDALRSLKNTDPTAYARLVAKLKGVFPNESDSPRTTP